jgi:hypothetical protein
MMPDRDLHVQFAQLQEDVLALRAYRLCEAQQVCDTIRVYQDEARALYARLQELPSLIDAAVQAALSAPEFAQRMARVTFNDAQTTPVPGCNAVNSEKTAKSTQETSAAGINATQTAIKQHTRMAAPATATPSATQTMEVLAIGKVRSRSAAQGCNWSRRRGYQQGGGRQLSVRRAHGTRAQRAAVGSSGKVEPMSIGDAMFRRIVANHWVVG